MPYDDLRMDLFGQELEIKKLGARFRVNTAVKKLGGRLELRGTVTVGDEAFSLHVPIEDQDATAEECAPIVRQHMQAALREHEVQALAGEEL